MGWTGGKTIALFFGITCATTLAGLIRGKAPAQRWISAPFLAVTAFLVVILFWNVIALMLPETAVIKTLKNVLCLVSAPLFGWLMGLTAANNPLNLVHKRGTLVEPTPERASRPILKTRGLNIAGQPIAEADETKHFKMIGTTGTGKSTAIRCLLEAALERGDRAVIADPDGHYMDRFYDARRGDRILNPFERESARWDLFAEMHTPHDADQLSRSLIVDSEGPDRIWRNYARVFLSAVLRQLHRVKHNDLTELYQLISTTSVVDLHDLLSDTAAGPYLAQDNGKFFGSVRAVANTHLAVLEHIAHQKATFTLSVREWVRGGHATDSKSKQTTGRILFLPYHANEIATLRGIISTWMRLAIFETMSQRPTDTQRDQRLWFVVDELDALGQIDGLKDALARLRKFGGRCVLGFQSIAQVSGTYGRAEAQTIVENCGNTLILRCSSSEGGGTARFASSLIGEREVIREQVTHGRSGGIFDRIHNSVSTSVQHVTESAVLASQIEQLPDLQGYLKLASQPEWKKVVLRAGDYSQPR